MWCSLMKSIIFSLDQPSALSPVKSSMSLSARVAGFAVLAVHQGVGEAAHMARSHPHLGVHQNGGVHAHVVGGTPAQTSSTRPFSRCFLTPRPGGRSPRVGKPAVNLAAGEDKAPGLTEVDDGIHSFFACFHSRWSAFLACNRVAGDIVPCSPPECNPVPGFSSRVGCTPGKSRPWQLAGARAHRTVSARPRGLHPGQFAAECLRRPGKALRCFPSFLSCAARP